MPADRTNLVLEEGAERFDELELQVFGKPAHVVVALDVGGTGSPAALHDIRVQGALHEVLDGLAARGGFEHERLGCALEAADEFAADDLALLLRVAHAGEGAEKLVHGVDGDKADTGRGDVVLLDLPALILAEEPVVDEDADELVADGLVHDRRGDSGIDAAGQTADDAPRSDLLPDAGDLFRDDVAAVPLRRDPRGAVQEVLENSLPVRGVAHFRVPLQPVEAAFVAREGGDGGGCRRREHLESFGRLRHRVAVAHPCRLLRRLAAEQAAVALGEGHRGGPVFTEARVGDLATELLSHDLESVADAEHGNPELEDPRIEGRGARFVDARRSAAQHDAGRTHRRDLIGRDRMGHDLGVDVRLAHPASDQLGVLGAEVDDEHGSLFGALRTGESRIRGRRRGFGLFHSLDRAGQRFAPTGVVACSSSASSACTRRVM